MANGTCGTRVACCCDVGVSPLPGSLRGERMSHARGTKRPGEPETEWLCGHRLSSVPEASGVTLDLVTATGTLKADRVFDVFGDHSYRMDLRG